MNIKKIYAKDSDRGTLVCEKCGNIKTINLSEFKNIGKLLKVKCRCGYVFSASIEFRKFYRKSTNLVGEYIRISRDISKGLEIGVMAVRFILDDDKCSEINKSAVVRQVSNNFVGAEFLDFDGFNEMNRTLGCYLMPR